MRNVNEFLRDELSCFEQLRVYKRTFHKLCDMIKNQGGLKESKICLLKRGLQYS